MTKSPPKTHVNEPLDNSKELSGRSRAGSDAPPEIQQKIIDIIIEEARKKQFNNRDLAYYLAIVKRESGFNPDAANAKTTASGIAQITDGTGREFGINDKNRFDARSSIGAGLAFFAKIKKKLIKDYGNAAGEYEPLIYFLYHYGENYHYNDRVKCVDPKPLSELKSNHRYADSKTVVDEADRIELILNDRHGLRIQLTDIKNIPVKGRKVLIVQKTEVKDKGNNFNNASPAAASANPTKTPATSSNSTPAPTPAKSNQTDASNSSEPSAASTKEQPSALKEASTVQSSSKSCDSVSELPVQWELVAFEVETDENGNIPEIESDTQEPFVVLIPRIDYDAYNEAVAKQLICEYGNEHEVKTRDGEEVLPSIQTQNKPQESKTEAKPAPKKAEPTPAAKKPTSILDAAAQDAADKKAAQTLPPPNSKADISFNDIVIAVKKDLGWKNVYETSFAYAKQFFTRPKLPVSALSSDTQAKKSAAPVQKISSSLPNKEMKTQKVKDKVTTTKETAVKPVEVNGDAPWMPIAIQEQAKDVQEVDGYQGNDSEWKSESSKFNEAEKAAKKARTELRKEEGKPKQKQDSGKITELKEEIKKQEKIKSSSDEKMREIEKKYNNPNIVKYLQSTSYSPAGARNDATAWCSAFANWCVEQSGYHGTGSAGAISWKNWGKKIDEPKYGAITIVTRNSQGDVHVGFFVKFEDKNKPDGFEEVEVKAKDGSVKKKKKQKFKSVKHVCLLSGNYSDTIMEAAIWTVDAADSHLHLVEYRWPTEKEKK